jgi:hypothetical protein
MCFVVVLRSTFQRWFAGQKSFLILVSLSAQESRVFFVERNVSFGADRVEVEN